ncbi:MAG: sporulation histidine kinase inhibitor Sda [Sporolactobacillus sp.]
MENLSDDLLIESYHKAKQYQLSEDFIDLIEKELERRKLKAIIAR